MIEDRQDTLFLILTRPPMKFGVPFEALVVNGVLTFFIGLWMGSPVYWLLAVAIHFPMRVVASRDHNFFRVGRLALMARANALRPSLWGGSMLSPLATRTRHGKERSSCV